MRSYNLPWRVLGFLVLFTTMSMAGAPVKMLDRLEASVNSKAILSSDVRRFKDSMELRTRLDPLFASSALSQKRSAATTPDIVEALIQDHLVLQAFPVTDAEVDQELNAIQSAQKISRERLREEIQNSGFRFEDYFELIRLSTAKRNLIDRDIRSKVSISEDDIKNHFYKKYAQDGAATLSYRVKLISFSRSRFQSAKGLQETVERASIALKSGDSFEEVARRFGDDSSGDSSIDLGLLNEDQMSPSIRKEVKKLKVGGVSPVFGDPTSQLFILKLSDISTGDDSRLKAAQEEIRAQLTVAEYHHQLQLWLSRQEQQASIHRALSR
ncbi:MAG: hypothetical protein RJB38_1967 [Pseudomonadota bacterium]|jgi:peptidyl-prolyl cis-trans isomerase SurA